jgi:hypothetical protein
VLQTCRDTVYSGGKGVDTTFVAVGLGGSGKRYTMFGSRWGLEPDAQPNAPPSEGDGLAQRATK